MYNVKADLYILTATIKIKYSAICRILIIKL
jgi:hypothetical protein